MPNGLDESGRRDFSCSSSTDRRSLISSTPSQGRPRKPRRTVPRRHGFVANGVGYIPLAGGGLALVDEADFAALSRFNWHQHAKGYAVREITRGGRRVRLFMHHEIRKRRKGFEIDHANRNRLDNRSSNLRYATASQNRVNRIYRTPASGYRGVRGTRSGKWEAHIVVRGKDKYLGTWTHVRHAASAYDLAAISIWGEFAVLNFPEMWFPPEPPSAGAQLAKRAA